MKLVRFVARAYSRLPQWGELSEGIVYATGGVGSKRSGPNWRLPSVELLVPVVPTKIIGVGLSLTKSGAGWSVVADIPGEEAWVEAQNTVIRFKKSFTLEVPIAPAVAKIPVIGEMVKDLGATKTSRVDAEGTLDVISYQGGLETRVS